MKHQKWREIFENLQGHWYLERKIHDFRSQEINTAIGTAHFLKKDKHLLDYEENGTLTLSENLKTFHFHRKYIYQLNPENITIILNDGISKGAIFQVLNFTDKENDFVGTEHLCGLDKYNGLYRFIHTNVFEIHYTVRGDKKNLDIHTIFQKNKPKPNAFS